MNKLEELNGVVEHLNTVVKNKGIMALVETINRTGFTDFSTIEKSKNTWRKIRSFYMDHPKSFGTTDLKYHDFIVKLINAIYNQATDSQITNTYGIEAEMPILLQDFFVENTKFLETIYGLRRTIKLPSVAKKKEEAKRFLSDHSALELDCVDDLVLETPNTWVVRTKWGNGPVVSMEGLEESDRHVIRSMYARMYGISYYEVRECTAQFWLDHPETRVSTGF
jgi:hypothetical protein